MQRPHISWMRQRVSACPTGHFLPRLGPYIERKGPEVRGLDRGGGKTKVPNQSKVLERRDSKRHEKRIRGRKRSLFDRFVQGSRRLRACFGAQRLGRRQRSCDRGVNVWPAVRRAKRRDHRLRNMAGRFQPGVLDRPARSADQMAAR